MSLTLIGLFFLGTVAFAENISTGVGAPAPVSFDQLVRDPQSECQFRGTPDHYTFRSDTSKTATERDYCVGAADCKKGSDRSSLIVFCPAEAGKCDLDVKKCHVKTVDGRWIASGASVTSTTKEEPLKDFKSCSVRRNSLRSLFAKLGEGPEDWHNLCLGGADCENLDGTKHPLTYIACNPEGVVKVKGNPQMVCPPVNNCINNRYLSGKAYP